MSKKYEIEVAQIQEKIAELQKSIRIVTSPVELEALEKEIQLLVNELGNALLGQKLQESVDSETMSELEKDLIADHGQRFKREKKDKDVSIRSRFGGKIRLEVDYYRRNCDRRRGKRHKGIYAALMLLGIHERCTPGVTSEVAMLAALLGSFAETQQVLSEQGIELNIKTIRLIAYRAAERTRMLQKMGHFGFAPQESVAGRRVVVSCDGGRVRLREKKRGPKTKKGRNHIQVAWREPKLFIIYVVDEDGKQSATFSPLVDGLIQGPNAIFALLTQYLKKLDIQEADQLLFISDGATWIWNRVPTLIQDLGIDKARVHLLIDFFHAVQHLHKAASLCKDWSATQRKRWVNKQRKLLHSGKIDLVIDALRLLRKGRRAKGITTELNYFIKHRTHMAYDSLLALNFPIGSGAVESAIRRIVNLRLKGPSIFWCKPNAESILLLRSYFKTGRWKQLISLALSPLVSHSFA